MQLFVIDFETFYDSKIKLGFRHQTTQEYLDDPRFEVVGVAVKVNDEETQSFSGTHEETKDWLLQFDWDRGFACAHNALFDMSILAWHYGIYPKKILDTLSMARALHGTKVGGSLKALADFYNVGAKGDEVIAAEGLRRKDFSSTQLNEYMAYCRNDVDLTYDILHEMLPHFNKTELELIDMTIRMHSEPRLHLDYLTLDTNLHMVQQMKEKLIAAAETTSTELSSNIKFAELLQQLGVEPPMKPKMPTKTNPNPEGMTYAFAKTDDAMKQLAEHPDVRVQALVAARTNAKSTLEESRTQRFMKIAEDHDELLPIPLRYYGAMTGRWSGCLVADTQVLVYNEAHGLQQKRIVDVLLDDLVWDGEEFVPHEGIKFSGMAEVISWDSITGTPDHVVYTEKNGEVPLLAAMQGGYRIKTPRSPTENDVDSARVFVDTHKS